jgi:membrane protease YdiL (CAAX protease family)
MIEQPSDSPAPTEKPPITKVQSRNPLGWVLLVILFSLAFYGALGAYLRPNKAEAPKPNLRQETMQIELNASMQLLLGDSAMLRESNRAAWTTLSERTEKLQKKDPEAAKITVVLKREAGEKLSKTDLAALAKAENGDVWTKVVSAEKPSLAEAKELANRITETDFIATLAKVQVRERGGDKEVRGQLISKRKGITAIMVGAVIGFIFLTGAICWVAFLIARKSGQFVPKGLPLYTTDGPTLDRIALLTAALFLGFLVLSLTIPEALQGFSPLIGSVVSGAVMLVWTGIAIKFSGFTLSDIGIQRKELGKNILLGIGAFTMELPLAGFFAFLGTQILSFLPAPSHPASNALMENQSPAVVMTMLFVGALVAPIWEEIMFRGLLFPAFTGLTRRIVFSGFASSFLFAMIHPQGIPLYLALATVGGASCMLLNQTRSLVPSIVMHACHNFTLMCFTFMLFS